MLQRAQQIQHNVVSLSAQNVAALKHIIVTSYLARAGSNNLLSITYKYDLSMLVEGCVYQRYCP